MQLLTALISAAVLMLYGILAYHNPFFTLLSPRGGALTLGLSLVMANVAIWSGGQPERSLNQRFQLIVAGWIWILVQLFGVFYLLQQMAGD